MKLRVSHRSLFMLLLIPVLAIAEDWDKRYDELCKNDRWCVRLKTQDGAWMKPKPEILAVIRTKEIQTEIHTAAAKYGVDPVAIAAAIVAENSMNVTKTDTAQTWLAKNLGITSVGTKKFSFGMGQINIDAAMEAENHIAQIEKRAPRTADEMTQEIADPQGSVRVAASIIRKVQDDYKAQGFDISKDVGVLTTLYNLGQSEQRAKATKAAGKTPQMNYFGTFVSKYFGEVKSAVGTAPGTVPPTNVIAAASAPPKTTDRDNGDVKVAEKIGARDPKSREIAGVKAPGGNPGQRSVASVPMVQTETVTKSISLIGAPHLCATTDEDRYDVGKTSTASFGAPTGILEKGSSFREISRTLDCNSISWKLLAADNGVTGWIKDETLDGIRAKKVEPAKNCDAEQKAAATCAASVSKALGEKVTASDLKMMVFGAPIGPKVPEGDKKPVNFEREDFQCRDRTKKAEDFDQPRYTRSRDQLSLNELAHEYDKYKANQKSQRSQQVAQLQQQQQQLMQQYQAQIAQAQAAAQTASQPGSPSSTTTNLMPTGLSSMALMGGGFGGGIPPGPISTPGSQSPKPRPPDKEIADANFKFYDQQANIMAKALKLSPQDLTSSSNPYAELGEFIMNNRTQASSCSVTLRSENRRRCELQPVSDEVKAAFQKIKYERVPDIDEAKAAYLAIETASSTGDDDDYTRDRGDGDIAPYMVYLPGETELANKSVSEIRGAIADCKAGLDELRKKVTADDANDDDSSATQNPAGGMVGAYGQPMRGKHRFVGGSVSSNLSSGGRYDTGIGEVGGYGDYESDPQPFFQAAKVASDEQIKKYASEFISLGKFCHSRLNVLKGSNTTGATIQCTQAPDFMNVGDGQFAKAMMAKTYEKNPQSLIESVDEHVPMFLKPEMVKEILGDQFKARPVAPKKRRRDEEPEYNPNAPLFYCPNRTAEKIEELLKENPCIKHVYVPTRYLSNKLGPSDPRVVYRQFEKNDRYGVEVGSVTCEK